VPDSRLHTVLERVRDRIAIANGAGSYTFNLTLSDAVQWGLVALPPPRDPTVFLVDVSVGSTQERNLGAYLRTVTIGFVGVVSRETNTEDGMLRAADLLRDIVVALELDRQLTSGVAPLKAAEDLVIRTMGLGYTDAFGVAGWYYCTGEIEIRYALASAVGV
jgi:hypothetical protein